MSTEDTETPVTGTSTGKNDDIAAKTYTEAEVLAKLRGSGKRIKELEKERDDALQAAAGVKQELEQAQQKVAMLTQDLSIVTTARNELLGEKEQAEAARAERCKARRSALPDDARALVPESLPPDIQEQMLDEVERRLANVGSPISVHGGPGRSPSEPADAVEAGAAAGRKFIFGAGSNNAKA